MATEQKENVEVKEDAKGASKEASASDQPRSEMANRVGNDVEVSDESASSEVVELDSQMIEELTGGVGAPGRLDTDMVQRFIGTVINDRYRIDEIIGRGGMGVVFKALHQTLDRPVVIKVLRPSKIDSDLARKRFEREAKRLCLLDHPNVVTIYDFGYHNRLGYLVMEYVDGITLSTFLKGNGPLTFAQYAPLAAGVLRGLSAAHDAGIVHRDIKASNAMLVVKNSKIDRIKLLDFGLAKLVTGSEDLTKKSELIGSMSAMAPERILGNEGDERVDVYAIGIMSYYLLAGEKPFQGEDVRVLYSHVHDPPPPLEDKLPEGHDVPSTVIEFINLCLAKDPEDRPRNAGEALEWLTSTVDNRAVFRLEDYPMEVPREGAPPEDSRSSRKILFEEGTPSWVRKRESGGYAKADQTQATERVKTDDDEESSGSSSKIVPVAAALGAAALLGVAGWFAFAGPGEQTDASAQKPAAQAVGSAAENATTEMVMEQIDKAIQERRFGTADEMLTTIQDELEKRPKLLSKAAEFRASIKKGQALVDAERHAEHLDLSKAIAAYRKVVSIDPRDEDAQQKLSTLESSSVLSIESNVDATVIIDGKEVGSTPFKKVVPAERVEIVLKADGYQNWSKRLTLPKGEQHELSAELEEPVRRAPRRVQRTRPAPKPKPKPTNNDGFGGGGLGDDSEGLNDDSLMQMD